MCEDVECPEVVPANCEGIIPPWGCCPVCGKLPTQSLFKMNFI